MLRLLFSLSSLLVLLLSASCQTPDEQKPEPAAAAVLPQAVLHLSPTDTLPYPIVEEYADLAPIFEQSDDKTYVINFWATWCGPCVEELPYFERLAEETQGEEVEIILVSLDFKKHVRTKLLKFIRERPLTLPVVALTDSKTNVWIDKVEPSWGGAIPITIVYKQDKRLFFEDQFDNYEELAEAVRSIQ